MDRKIALTLFDIYKVEKELGRAVYPDDLVSRQVLSKNAAQHMVDQFYFKNWLIQETKKGANVYRLSRAGIDGMCSYRDIKLQIEHGILVSSPESI